MNRHTFLAASAAGAALAPVLTASSSSAASAEFEKTAFLANLARPYKHKQVVASTRLENGRAMHYMRNSIDGFAGGYGDGPGSLHSVAVLYGFSIVSVLDDAMWSKYAISATLAGLKEPDAVPMSPLANPYVGEVAKLVADGATFFVCNNALNGISGVFGAKKLGIESVSDAQRKAVRDEFAAHMLPGVMIVPAGVVAITVAQESGFALIQGSL
jgi:intracellular sulfur oxidation DsrE/DsrF family protein